VICDPLFADNTYISKDCTVLPTYDHNDMKIILFYDCVTDPVLQVGFLVIFLVNIVAQFLDLFLVCCSGPCSFIAICYFSVVKVPAS
jgi:hypothetical protein